MKLEEVAVVVVAAVVVMAMHLWCYGHAPCI
jgi:hypothetical protein